MNLFNLFLWNFYFIINVDADKNRESVGENLFIFIKNEELSSKKNNKGKVKQRLEFL